MAAAPGWQAHVFLGPGHHAHERRTRIVIALTAAMMVLEIVCGTLFGSMALLADGWHMASHAAALSMTALAYYLARRHATSPRFTFGTGKIGQLAGYSSALLLGVIAALMAYESVKRLAAPVAIAFDVAIAVTVGGLAVNILSALLLDDRDEGHEHATDHNLRAAHAHVLADAMTSVLALAALTCGRFFGWVSLDPVMGIVGAAVIVRWSLSLARGAARTLLDMNPQGEIAAQIRRLLEAGGDVAITDLHVWSLGPGHLAAIVSLSARDPRAPAWYKERLGGVCCLSHVTVEVERL